MKRSHVMRYQSPAEIWDDALPLGNGKLGAMVYGRTDIERIPLNDDSLWYGTYADRNNPALREKLPEIRRLMLAGRIPEAEELMMQYMVGVPSCQRRYTPLGELDIALNQRLPFIMGGRPASEPPEAYDMRLNLDEGLLSVAHTQNGVKYLREMFVSEPAQVMCVRVTTETPGAINLDAKLDRITMADSVVQDDRRPGLKAAGGGWNAPSADVIRSVDDQTFFMQGHDAQVKFTAAFRMESDGEIINPVSQLGARNASEVVIYLASSTSNRSQEPDKDVFARLDAAQKKGYEALKREHVADFSALMDRCDLWLGEEADLPTDLQLKRVREGGEDGALAALYFQYGRYLIASGSRRGSAPLNLQGIWNAEYIPMWDSKFTININLQMNYWLSETGNLSDLHEPFMDLLETMHERGKETARAMYGMRGMACHHNTDFYGDCAPQDKYMASTTWVVGGAWMAMHVWEHYLFTRDVSVLRRMYPIFKDLALFYEDFLMEVDGKLVTCPSVSPENRYILPDGYDTPVCIAPAMDNQILREFFSACIKTIEILKVDQEYAKTLEDMIAKLPGDQIGSKGQLLEWDKEYPELTPGMGHVSHLYAAYPGSSINWRETPELLTAVGKSLELRTLHQKAQGQGRGGWPLAWYINLYARMLDGKLTDDAIREMLTHSATRSFLNARKVFQIDGNLGAAAGIAECLLQSHVGLHFLPALPESWKNGSLRGFCARGGHEVDLAWEEGRLKEAVVKPRFDGPIEVVGDVLHITCADEAVSSRKTQHGFAFDARADCKYVLRPYA